DSCKNQNIFLVFQLLTDLKQQRKESGKSKQSSGQQNLNTIMYEVGDTDCMSSTEIGSWLKADCLACVSNPTEWGNYSCEEDLA
uniref:Uncharacterized protein n=1 Tax=Pavo cristatus TaxID=9049 RepID=A0A8C9ERY5_PAVCR